MQESGLKNFDANTEAFSFVPKRMYIFHLRQRRFSSHFPRPLRQPFSEQHTRARRGAAQLLSRNLSLN
jgi:hypothetical protein